MKKMWDDRAGSYDDWYRTFRGAVEHYVDWELLNRYLPKDKTVKILDAAGGTGRMTVPLARKGHSLTLCDISPGMLSVARGKVLSENIGDRVDILNCDVHRLPLASESFDFVLCWDGGADAAQELIRVTKRGGRISTFLVNRWAAVMDSFYENPDCALSFTESCPSYLEDQGGKHMAVNPDEARDLFAASGITVLGIHAVYGWLDALNIPKKVLESRHWDEKLFAQTAKMALMLSQEPSVQGMSKHLVLYGEKN
jgi:SAM-dependent methyltransferase